MLVEGDSPQLGREAVKKKTSSPISPSHLQFDTIISQNMIPIWLSKYFNVEHGYYGVNIAQRNLHENMFSINC